MDRKTILEITEPALRQITALRDQESIPGLSLGVRIAGVGHSGFIYETAFLRAEDVDHAQHHVEVHGDLPVAIPPDSIDNLRGSVLDVSSDPAAPGLVLRNPNPASPTVGGPAIPEIELTGSVEERVAQLLDQALSSLASSGYRQLEIVVVNDGSNDRTPRSQSTTVLRRSRSEERRVGKECRSRWSPYH